MNMRKALVVGVVLAGLLLMLQFPLRMVAQDQPPQDQVQPQQDQGQPPQAQGPAQDPPGRVARPAATTHSMDRCLICGCTWLRDSTSANELEFMPIAIPTE